MRIVMPCGPSHRDDGGPYYIQKYLNRIEGVRCDRIPVTVPEREWGAYDGVIYVDWGQDAFSGLPFPDINPDKPSVCWLSDTHMSPAARDTRYGWAKKFRRVAFYMPDAAAEQGAAWLPAAGDHEIYRPIPTDEYSFVGFVGSTGDRARRDSLLTEMIRAIPRFAFGTGMFFGLANAVYQSSRIVLNCSLRSDLNMRTFEVLLAGRLLLTDRQMGMEELGLRDGVHCVMYENVEDCVQKAQVWLKKDEEREVLAQRGREWALAGHTFAHRARTLLSMLR